MMMQLNPQIHVVVLKLGKDMGKGYALGWIDYSQDHHLLWIVAMDKTGEVWIIPNNDIRLELNYSVSRNLDDVK